MSLAARPHKSSARVRLGWSLFDWANSAFSLTITTAVFPLYFHGVAKDPSVRTGLQVHDGTEYALVSWMGLEMNSVSLMSLCVSIAFGIIVLFSPLLGSLADASGHKKHFMAGATLLGGLSCIGLFWFTPDWFTLGAWLFITAALGYAGGIIFNDALLPDIAWPEHIDTLSARGYTMGYIGSVLLLIQNLTMLMVPEWYGGIDSSLACRLSFLLVGVWWLMFAAISYALVPEPVENGVPLGISLVKQSFEKLKDATRRVWQLPELRRFMFAFFLYDMAIQTVMYMATSFGTVELKLKDSDLIITVLAIQLLGVAGAYAMAWLSGRLGNIQALMTAIICWTATIIYTWFIHDAVGFYIAGALVGLVMGGTQALSRSTFGKLIPPSGENTTFFSFYSVADKLATMTGTFIFTVITNSIGMRNSILALTVMFLGGLLMLAPLRRSVLR